MRSASTCKVCRRLGVSVCGREKCALKRKPYPPGIHGKAFRRSSSEFGAQLQAKQKVKFSYGLREAQFKKYIVQAISQKSQKTSEAILTSLESRLDNIVYRLGFASTRAAARQMVNHGHIWVNGKRVTIPSYQVRMKDEIAIRPGSAQKKLFTDFDAKIKKYTPPVWMDLDKEKRVGRMLARPTMDEFERMFNINSIVEYYSR